MGTQDERELNKRDTSRSKAKQAREGRRSKSSPIEVTLGHWLVLAAMIEIAARRGGAVRVGFTRDGGAWALGMYAGDDYATEYIRPAEDFTNAVREITEAWFPNTANELEKLIELYCGT